MSGPGAEERSSPTFSVVVPVYNRAATILPTLQSVRAQSFRDLECVIVDDGSVDGAALRAIVEGLGNERFRLVTQINSGGGAARNRGIDESRGRYIAFLDSDDLFLSDKLAGDLRLLEAGDAKTVVFSRLLADRGGGRSVIKPHRAPRRGEAIADYLTVGRGFMQTSTLAMPAELARKVRFAEGLPFGQDTDFAIRLHADGARFVMRPAVTVVMNDRIDTARVSQQKHVEPMLQWLAQTRPQMGERAYYAYRGWHIARLAAATDKRRALRYYFEALARGALPPKLAAMALVQILLPRRIYRGLDLRARKMVSPRSSP